MVAIRADASTSDAKVIAWPTGTTVNAYTGDDKWYNVEYDGWWGYVQEQYVELK